MIIYNLQNGKWTLMRSKKLLMWYALNIMKMTELYDLRCQNRYIKERKRRKTAVNWTYYLWLWDVIFLRCHNIHMQTCTHTHTLSLSLSHTHTHFFFSLSHTHTLFLSLSHTHTLSLSLSLTHTHKFSEMKHYLQYMELVVQRLVRLTSG